MRQVIKTIAAQYRDVLGQYKTPKIEIDQQVTFSDGQPRDKDIATIYDPLGHMIFIDETTAALVRSALADRQNMSKLYSSMFQLIAHTVTLSLARQKLAHFPYSGNGYFEIEHGLSIMNGEMRHGRCIKQSYRHGPLNEAVASYLTLTAIRHQREDLYQGVLNAYQEWGIDRTIAIGERLSCLTSSVHSGALERAFFLGDQRIMRSRIAKHVTEADLMFELLATRNGRDNLDKALDILGGTVTREPVRKVVA